MPGSGLRSMGLGLRLRLGARRAAAGVVRRVPVPVADRLRGPATAPPGSARGRAHHLLLEALRRGGIPAGVATFALGDHPELRFVSHDSLVLHQLYWFGEQGWEPRLLPWWRHCCARASAVLELGANVGYFTVQGATAAPGARYVAVEPHPVSAGVCRANLALNGIGSVELLEAAAAPGAGPSAVELQVPADQLGTPTVAFLGDRTELPDPMRRHVTGSVAVPAVDVRTLLPGVDRSSWTSKARSTPCWPPPATTSEPTGRRCSSRSSRGRPGSGSCWPTCAATTATGVTCPSPTAAWSGWTRPTSSAPGSWSATAART